MSPKSQEQHSPFGMEDKAGQSTDAPEQVKAPVKRDEEPLVYKRVKFYPKTDKNQPDNVTLSLNGVTLLIQRDKEIVLSNAFLALADHATYAQFRHSQGEGRKEVARIRLYPYQVVSDATEKEFMEMRATGARRQEEARLRDESVQKIA